MTVQLRVFGGNSPGQMGARNLFRSSRPLSTIWQNEFRVPKNIWAGTIRLRRTLALTSTPMAVELGLQRLCLQPQRREIFIAMESGSPKLHRSDMEMNMPPRWGFSSFDVGRYNDVAPELKNGG